MIGPALRRTLDVVAADCADLRDPWWLIGSSAALLIGLDERANDVDLLTSRRDAETLLQRWGVIATVPAASAIFRSELFAARRDLPLPIEIMAGLHVRGERLRPASRVRLPWPPAALFVPDRAEQIRICRAFGRSKDLARAERLGAETKEKAPAQGPGLSGSAEAPA